MKPTALLLLFLPSAVSSPCFADAPPRYKMTVLPLSVGGHDQLDNFDFSGGIKGTYILGTQTVHKGRLSDERAALWQQGHPVRLLDTTPVTPQASSSSLYTSLTPTALNRRGECVGYSYYTFSGAWSSKSATACLWRAGQSTKLLGYLPTAGRADLLGFPPDTDSVALAINDSSEIVGSVSYNNHDKTPNDNPPARIAGTHAFLRRKGKIRLLWPGIALGISNRGWIVGIKDTGDDLSSSGVRGILWRNGQTTLFKMQPVAISGSGEIAGNIPLTEDDGRACVWQQGRITRLSKQTSHAYALNNKQQVVGELDGEAKPFPTHAVLWQNDRTFDLNRCVPLPKGWVLSKAIGINDSGWIIGEGSVSKTLKSKPAVQIFTFLLTPR